MGRHVCLPGFPSDRRLEIELHRSAFVRLLRRLLNPPSMLISARTWIAIIHSHVAILLRNHELDLREETPNLRTDGMAVAHHVFEAFFPEAFR